MIAFIDGHRDSYGVEPICRFLPIAPSTYHERFIRPRGSPALRGKIAPYFMRSSQPTTWWLTAAPNGSHATITDAGFALAALPVGYLFGLAAETGQPSPLAFGSNGD